MFGLKRSQVVRKRERVREGERESEKNKHIEAHFRFVVNVWSLTRWGCFLVLIFNIVYFFESERRGEREREGKRGRERERDKTPGDV